MSARSRRDLVPLGLSVAAVIVAALGLTPAGHAASRILDQVGVAQDTNAVNGIRASRTPRPNRLLPLGADARFPAGVVPDLPGGRGPEGSAGEPGPAGAPGRDGGAAVIVHRDDPLELPGDGTAAVVLRFDDLHAGAFVMTAGVELSSVQSFATPVRCALVRGDTELGHGVSTLGIAPGGARITTLSLIGTLDAPEAATVVLQCAATATGAIVDVEGAQASALSVASVTAFEVNR